MHISYNEWSLVHCLAVLWIKASVMIFTALDLKKQQCFLPRNQRKNTLRNCIIE